MEAPETTVVCDLGSGSLKVGFAGHHYPRAIVRSVVEKSTTPHQSDTRNGAPKWVYKPVIEANYQQGCVENDGYENPCVNGIVANWDAMQVLLEHTFSQLQIDPASTRILVTDPPLNSENNRNKMLEMLFETFGFSRVLIQASAVLALYSQGLTTGLVVDSGAAATHIVPVSEGYSDPHQIKRLCVAGDHVTQRLSELLLAHGYCITAGHSAAIRELKERCCYVAANYAQELELAKKTTFLAREYILPDGQRIRLTTERFQAAEVIFNPGALGHENAGLSEAVYACINDLPIDVRRDMYETILMGGGTMMLPGLSTRLQRDLETMYLDRVLQGDESKLQNLKLRIQEPSLRRHMAFGGASVLAGVLAGYDDKWKSRQQYLDSASSLAVDS